MFFLGALSNTLPYLFLFVLYVVGMGSWLLGKPKVEEQTAETVAVNTITVAEEKHVTPNNTVHFSECLSGIQSEQAEKLPTRKSPGIFKMLRHKFFLKTGISEKLFTSRLFSRPPPVMCRM